MKQDYLLIVGFGDCEISNHHTSKFHVSEETLYESIEIQSIQYY